MTQPHISQMPIFDPAVAYVQNVRPLMELVDGAIEDPTSLPPEEILWAARIAVDTMRAITDITAASLLSRLGDVLDPDAVSTHKLLVRAEESDRSVEETMAYQLKLLERVSMSMPHEGSLDDPEN